MNKSKRRRCNSICLATATNTCNEKNAENDSEYSKLPVDGKKILEECQDSANNNDNSELNSSENPSSSQKHVTLEALENTKVAVAQFAATALANGADENAVKDLALLQSTLFTLQHQQVFQLQLIQKLQSQLDTTSSITKKLKLDQNDEKPSTQSKETEQIKEIRLKEVSNEPKCEKAFISAPKNG